MCCSSAVLQVKFYAPLYESDVILASPLALATRLAEGGMDKGDILSSIDVAIIYRGDIMLMQNWAHVETVLQALNQIPSRQHDSDIMRVRCVFACPASLFSILSVEAMNHCIIFYRHLPRDVQERPVSHVGW